MVSIRATPRIPTRTRRTELVSIMEKKVITCKCKLLKNKKKDEEGNVNETNVIEDIVAMVSGMHIDMITEIHMAVIANSFDW